MADDDTPGDDPTNPFESMGMFGMPMFGDLSKMLAGQGPLNWDAARQFAVLSASGDPAAGMAGMMGAMGGPAGNQPAITGTPNIDPAVRIKYEELTEIVRPQIADVMGVDIPSVDTSVATPEQWATETLEAYRPLFTDLATSLGGGDADLPDEADGDPMAQMLLGLTKMMAPAMMGMSVGSMVGSLARRAFGVYDLPIPRATPALVIVPPTVDAFASEWSIDVDEMRLWVLAHEVAGLALFSIPHVADHLRSLAQQHVGAFRPDPNALTDKLTGLDADPMGGGNPFEAIQQAFGDPEVLLGAVRSEEQLALEPALDAAVATTIGVIDWVVDAVAVRLIGGDSLQIAEAVRRRRADTSPDDVFVERLLGIRLGPDQTARGKAFVQGVVDRVGDDGIILLFTNPESMPTPNEIEAPGLWLARVDPSSLD